MQRRKFLKNSALTVAGTTLAPLFLQAFQNPGWTRNGGNQKLIVVQLSGGNDGLNTVVPFQNDIYYKLRPTLSLKKKDLIHLNDELALNGEMQGLADLFLDGQVSIVNSVGYPNPNRSHFRSMEIWQTASNSDEYLSSGWLGRYLDSKCSSSLEGMKAHQAIELGNSLSLSLKGESQKGLALQKAKQLYGASNTSFYKQLSEEVAGSTADNTTLNYLNKTMVETISSSAYLYEKSKIHSSRQNYPNTSFGNQLKTVAELIISGSDTQVYYLSLGGFDTHAQQRGQQNRLLKTYSEGIAAFAKDMKANNQWEEVALMTFSEFGRRVKQNASGGTDHGTANNVFLMGGKLQKPGFFNAAPDLEQLDEGDLKYQIDFRQIYASVLEDWLQVQAAPILQQNFDKLALLHS